MLEDKRRSLLTYALVSQSLIEQNDILLGLVPLFRPIVKKLAGTAFDPRKFSREVKEYYDIGLSEEISSEIRDRLHQAGYLTLRAPNTPKGQYTYVSQDISHNEASLETDIGQSINSIVDRLWEFSRNFKSLYILELTRENLSEILFNWLLDKHKILSQALHALGYPEEETEPKNGYEHVIFRNEHDYFCSRFVTELKKTDATLYDHLALISIGIMVSEVIADLRKPPENLKKARDLSLYIDAPFLMDALRLTGQDRADGALFILDKLKKLEISLYTFDFYRDEISENLRAVLGRHPTARTGPTADGLRSGAVREDYAQLVLKQTDTYLEGLGINVISSNISFTDKEVSYFPLDLEQSFYAELSSWTHHQARERDKNAISFIMRRRRGIKTTDFFASKLIILSHNSVLCRRAQTFCIRNGLIYNNQIGPAILQSKLSALLWLTLGSSDKISLSRSQLVSNCARAVASRGQIIDSILTTLKSVKPEQKQQIEAMLATPRGVQLAMDFVLANAAKIDQTVVEQMGLEYEQEISLKAESKFQDKLRFQDHKHKNEIESYSSESIKKDEIISELADKTEKHKEQEKITISTLYRFVKFSRNGVSKISSFAVLISTFLLIIDFAIDRIFNFKDQSVLYLLSILICLVITSFSNWPSKVPPLKRALDWLSDISFRYLVGLFGLQEHLVYLTWNWQEPAPRWDEPTESGLNFNDRLF